jgi:transposase
MSAHGQNGLPVAQRRLVAASEVTHVSWRVPDRHNSSRRAFYRRLAARIGKAKAVTATARKIVVLFYNAMRFGIDYKDPGATHYEKKYRERVIKQLHRRAAEFGFALQEAVSVS